VPQAIFLADASFAENIAFGVPAEQIDLQRVREAAQRAQIADFIEVGPSGYAAMVGERGVRLSGGQRQRIGIARALHKQATVIIFDEATSALDNDTEKAVMESIEALDQDLTLLIVAHRLSTLRSCTQVIELSNGAVRRIGTYEAIAAPRQEHVASKFLAEVAGPSSP
jgi:ATP-binding cassette subfamily B protein